MANGDSSIQLTNLTENEGPSNYGQSERIHFLLFYTAIYVPIYQLSDFSWKNSQVNKK